MLNKDYDKQGAVMMSVVKKGNGALDYTTLLSVLNDPPGSTAALIDHSFDFWSWLKPSIWGEVEGDGAGLRNHTEPLHWCFDDVAGNYSKEMKDRSVRVVCNSACGVNAAGSEHNVKSVLSLHKETGAYQKLPSPGGPTLMRPFPDDAADRRGTKEDMYHRDIAKVATELAQLPPAVLSGAGTSSAAVTEAWDTFVNEWVPPKGVATDDTIFEEWGEPRSVWPLPWMVALKADRQAARLAGGAAGSTAATADAGGGSSSMNGVLQPQNHPAAIGAPIVSSQDPAAAAQAACRKAGHDAVNYTFPGAAPVVKASTVHLIYTPYPPYLWPAGATSNVGNNGKTARLFWGSDSLDHSSGCGGDQLGDDCTENTCPLSKARADDKCVAVRWYDLADTRHDASSGSSSDSSSDSNDGDDTAFSHISVADDAGNWAQAAIDGKTGHRDHPLAAAAEWGLRSGGHAYGGVTDQASDAALSRVEEWRVGPRVEVFRNGKLKRESQKIYAASLVKLMQDKYIT